MGRFPSSPQPPKKRKEGLLWGAVLHRTSSLQPKEQFRPATS